MRTSAPESASGFTLLELMVALLIVGTALAVVAPALPGPPGGAEAEAKELVRLFDRARRAAAERGRTITVELNLDRGSYQVRARDEQGNSPDSVVAKGELRLSRRPHATPATAVRWAVVRFDPSGRAEGGPIRLWDEEEHHLTVVIDRWTGRVHVERK